MIMAGVPLLPTRSSIAEYGVGCGNGPFDLAVSGSAAIGGPGVQLQMQAGTPNALAFLVYDFGRVTLLDLGAFGFPGCTAYPTNPGSTLIGILDPSGTAPPMTIQIPNSTGFLSVQLVVQGAALDPVNVTAEFSDAGIMMLGL